MGGGASVVPFVDLKTRWAGEDRALKDKLMLSYHHGRTQPYTLWVNFPDGDQVVRFCSTPFEVRWWSERLRRDLEEPTGRRPLPSGVRC